MFSRVGSLSASICSYYRQDLEPPKLTQEKEGEGMAVRQGIQMAETDVSRMGNEICCSHACRPWLGEQATK